MTYGERLIEAVATQIHSDVENGDTTAIHEMFKDIHVGVLEAFLPEEVLIKIVHNEQ